MRFPTSICPKLKCFTQCACNKCKYRLLKKRVLIFKDTTCLAAETPLSVLAHL